MTSRKTTRPPVSLHPLAPAYRLSAARHSARASANANAATRAAASAISGRNRPVSADAGIVVVQAIGMRYRSEEGRVGKEGRSRWSPIHYKKKVIVCGECRQCCDV